MHTVGSAREQAGDTVPESWLEGAARDFRYALRQHVRDPGFAALVVLTLSIGIGANVVMVGAIDRLLLRAPPHVREPETVARLLLVAPNPLGGDHISARSNYPTFEDMQREVPSLESVGAYWSLPISFGLGPEAVEVRASLVTSSFMSLLGVAPALGRLFSPDDEASWEGTPMVVLGHAFWQRRFGSDSTVVDQTVRIGDESYAVIGVTPKGFHGLEAQPVDVWLPLTSGTLRASNLTFSLNDRGSGWLSIVARIQRDATRAQVEQQATNIWLQNNAPAGSVTEKRRVVAASVILGRSIDRPRGVNIAIWLAGIAVLVLMIACANVTNLLLARAFARRREIAVRVALGASPGRLARQLLAEGMLLAGVGGLGALYLALLGGPFVQGMLQSGSSDSGFFDLRLFVITATIAVATGVVVSLAPLLQATALDLTRSLRTGAASTGGQGSRVRTALLTAQAALCMVLLITAGLFAQSLRRVEGLDLGLDLNRTVRAKIDLGSTSLPQAEIRATYASMLERVLAVEGVTRAALAEHDPYKYGRAVAAHTPKHSPESLWHKGVLQVPMEVAVDSGFFTTVGAVSLRGRDFREFDRRGSARVAIINENLAKLLWPGEEALNQCMLVDWEGGDCVTVVGVIHGFMKGSVLERDRLVVYVPMAQSDYYIVPGTMFVATTGDHSKVIPSIRTAIQSAGADMPAVTVDRMRDVVGLEFRPWRLAAIMFSIFGAVALLIAVVGLYGVVAFTATQRSTEVAVRTALGAQPKHVLSVVAGEGLRAVIIGLVIGSIAALGLRRWIGPMLFETSPADPGIIAAVGMLLFTSAAVASLFPTVRMLRQNLAATLRVE